MTSDIAINAVTFKVALTTCSHVPKPSPFQHCADRGHVVLLLKFGRKMSLRPPKKLFGMTLTSMSLYYEAADILSNTDKAGGSLKSRIYNKKDLKSSPANVFALVSEATRWSAVLKDVVEKAGVLREKKVCSSSNPSAHFF